MFFLQSWNRIQQELEHLLQMSPLPAHPFPLMGHCLFVCLFLSLMEYELAVFNDFVVILYFPSQKS